MVCSSEILPAQGFRALSAFKEFAVTIIFNCDHSENNRKYCGENQLLINQ